jgi:hypothetical protein
VTTAYLADRSDAVEDVRSVADHPRTGTGKGQFVSLEVAPLDADGAEAEGAVTGCDLVLRTLVECREDFADANVAVEIWDTNGTRVIDANLGMKGESLSLRRGQSARVEFRLRDVLLRPGEYSVTLWLGRGGIENMDHAEAVRRFSVAEDLRTTKHTENFPGIYRCRFEHSLDARSGAAIA